MFEETYGRQDLKAWVTDPPLDLSAMRALISSIIGWMMSGRRRFRFSLIVTRPFLLLCAVELWDHS